MQYLKVFHSDPSKLDKLYQDWVKTFTTKHVNIVSFTSVTAYHMTTMTVQYELLKKVDD